MFLQIFSVIIHGPGSLDCEHGIKGPLTIGQIWELTEVTPGAIAASAIYVSLFLMIFSLLLDLTAMQARFALSSNVALQQQGKSTKIDYKGDFNIYLRYLITGQSENKLSIHKIFDIWNDYFFPLTAGSRHPTLAFAPAHVIDDAFAALANDLEETDDLINSHGYNDNIGNQGSSRNTCDLLGDIPVPLTVLQSQEVQFSKDVQFGMSPGVEVLSLIRMRAGTLRAPVTNEQEATDGLAVKGRGCGNARVNADNGNALPAKAKAKCRGRGRQ